MCWRDIDLWSSWSESLKVEEMGVVIMLIIVLNQLYITFPIPIDTFDEELNYI